jgi:hypothetical protein
LRVFLILVFGNWGPALDAIVVRLFIVFVFTLLTFDDSLRTLLRGFSLVLG